MLDPDQVNPPFIATVNLTFTATAPAELNNVRFHFAGPQLVVRSHLREHMRTASVTGTVTGLSTSFSPGASATGFISEGSNSNLQVQVTPPN